MKKIKVKICNLDQSDHCSYGYLLLNILKKYYEVELSENPDYIFYSESTFEHLNYTGIKIFYTGENVHPNFNLCDYAIGFDYMQFGDRYCRFPVYLAATFYRDQELKQLAGRSFDTQLSFTSDDLSKKTGFCSFVYSNYLADNARGEFFEKLSQYKKVNSGGAYLNNTGGRTPNKLEFESRHKFSIAFENSSREGYTTEKLPTALMACTIPIYWGNPEIGKEFNTARFINCNDYKDFDDVISRIKEIDADDNLYLSIVNQPVSTGYDFKEVRQNLEMFIKNIIDQPVKEARRIKISTAKSAQIRKEELLIAKYHARQLIKTKILALIYRPFKKSKTLEKIKQKYFIRKYLNK